MPGPLVHLGATVQCAHAAPAQPNAPIARVTVMGQPVVTIVSPYTVTGCPHPSNAGGPCATGQMLVGSTRVTVMGQPVVLLSSTGTCVPTATPLIVSAAQTRVVGI